MAQVLPPSSHHHPSPRSSLPPSPSSSPGATSGLRSSHSSHSLFHLHARAAIDISLGIDLDLGTSPEPSTSAASSFRRTHGQSFNAPTFSASPHSGSPSASPSLNGLVSTRSLTNLAALSGSAAHAQLSGRIKSSTKSHSSLSSLGRSKSAATLSDLSTSSVNSRASLRKHTQKETTNALNQPTPVVGDSQNGKQPLHQVATPPKSSFTDSKQTVANKISPKAQQPSSSTFDNSVPKVRRRRDPRLIRSASLSDISKKCPLVPLTSLSQARAEEEAARSSPPESGCPSTAFSRTLSQACLNSNTKRSAHTDQNIFNLPSLETIMSLTSDNIQVVYASDSGSDDSDDDEDDFSMHYTPRTRELKKQKQKSYNSRIKQLRKLRFRNNGSPNESVPTETESPESDNDSGLTEPAAAEDDCAILRPEPERQVDYLAHNWCEEEVSSSWRVIVSKRWYYGKQSRLENASWRSWAKHKYGLPTVDPEKLNWYKDEDASQLYGPFLPKSHAKFSALSSEDNEIARSTSGSATPTSRLETQHSLQRPILKKRSASEVMLFDSKSAFKLLREAAATERRKREQCSEKKNRKSSESSECAVMEEPPVSTELLAVAAFPPRRPGFDRRHSDKSFEREPSEMQLTPLHELSSKPPKTINRKPRLSEGSVPPKRIRFLATVEQCVSISIDEEEEEDDGISYINTTHDLNSRGDTRKLSKAVLSSLEEDDDEDDEGGMIIDFRPRLARMNANRNRPSPLAISSVESSSSPTESQSDASWTTSPRRSPPLGNSNATLPFRPMIKMLPPAILRSDSEVSHTVELDNQQTRVRAVVNSAQKWIEPDSGYCEDSEGGSESSGEDSDFELEMKVRRPVLGRKPTGGQVIQRARFVSPAPPPPSSEPTSGTVTPSATPLPCAGSSMNPSSPVSSSTSSPIAFTLPGAHPSTPSIASDSVEATGRVGNLAANSARRSSGSVTGASQVGGAGPQSPSNNLATAVWQRLWGFISRP